MFFISFQSTIECIDKLDQYATSTAEVIFSTFQNYHSILQNLEKDAYDQLKKRSVDTLRELHAVQNVIDASDKRIAVKIISHFFK